jgi:signal peptidase I
VAKVQGRFETIKTVAVAIALAVLFRSFLYEPFHIPSGSMKDTLLVGDFIFVSKYSYGYSRYSFPLGLPLFEGRIGGNREPERGDIIVFRLPRNPHIDYIKRLIGMPGDTIQMKKGTLYLNGKAIPKERVEDFVEHQPGNVNRIRHVPKFRETLPNGVSYFVLDEYDDYDADDTDVYTVPEGHYFFMGDNRDNSIDSRFLDDVGYVPMENIVGPARIVAISVEEGESLLAFWKWGESLRTDRFGIWLNQHWDEQENAANAKH